MELLKHKTFVTKSVEDDAFSSLTDFVSGNRYIQVVTINTNYVEGKPIVDLYYKIDDEPTD